MRKIRVMNIILVFSVYLLSGIGFSQDEQQRSTLYKEIMSGQVPGECPGILQKGARYLEQFSGEEGAAEITMKMLECEQDWDLIREKLHELIRSSDDQGAVELASLTLMNYLLLKGDYEAVLDLTREFGLNHPSSRALPRVLFIEGLALLESGHYSSANQKFLLLVLRYPDSDLAGPAQMGIAESYFQTGKYSDALAQFKLAGKKITGTLFALRLDQRMAVCYRETGDLPRAIQSYQRIIEAYPDSSEAEQARTSIEQMKAEAGSSPIELPTVHPTPKVRPTEPIGQIIKESVIRDTVPHMAGSTRDRRYTIQVGAFKNRQNALDLLDALKIKGYEAYFLDAEQTNSTISKVRVGKCLPRAEAERIMEKLLKEEQMYTYLTPCSEGSLPE
ncbi:tetratricopeptide repeat protein [bacterium]|nr:tetratricopeptide repeat protein [bacterium]